VVDFETAYNAFLGWPALTKFIAIPHYAYLVLKMPGPRGSSPFGGGTSSALMIVTRRVMRWPTDWQHPGAEGSIG
jgi:hypothetical protein